MRFDVGTKFVTAKEHIGTKKRVAFAFEIIIIWQPGNLVAAFFHPRRKMRRFASPFFVAKVTRNKCFADGESSVGGKNHVRQFRLWRNQFDFRVEFRERRVQPVPLFLSKSALRAASAAHPGVDLVLDAVMIRRAKKELAHKIDNYLSRSFVTSAPCSRKRWISSSNSARVGAVTSIRAKLGSTRF